MKHAWWLIPILMWGIALVFGVTGAVAGWLGRQVYEGSPQLAGEALVPSASRAGDEKGATEYYRGAYDMCVAFGVSVVQDPVAATQAACNQLIAQLFAQSSHATPSEGYVVPH